MDPLFTFSGKVARGNRLGRSFGFPTINFNPEQDQLLPLDYGVYAVKIRWQDQFFNGMGYYGFRPSLGEVKLVLEVNIFDFSGELYDEEIAVYFYDFIRGDRKFSSMEELRHAIANDGQVIRKLFSSGLYPDPNAK
jgi:riboflavin kinase / FMN adenylyltransferase